MKRGQGKSLGWFRIKSEILRAVADGKDTRGKLKGFFSDVVSTKDIDYHLWGTPGKPGLVRRGILKDENGNLTLNLQTVDHLEEILTRYLLSFPEFKRGLDLEFSACYLSCYGDSISIRSDGEDHLIMRDYGDWAIGYMGEEKQAAEQRFIEFARRKYLEKRGTLDERDKISYVVAFYSLLDSVPTYEDLERSPKIEKSFGELSSSEITLVWKDMNLIREMARSVPGETIKTVFERLCSIVNNPQSHSEFIGGSMPNSVSIVGGLMGRLMYEGIDSLIFHEDLFGTISSAGQEISLREMIKSIKAIRLIPLGELERLGTLLKNFNDSQKGAARLIMEEAESLIVKYHGGVNP